MSARPSAGAGTGDQSHQREETAADHPRDGVPAVPFSFQRVPGLHGDLTVADVPLLVEPRRQPHLPHAGQEDRNGAGTSAAFVFGYGSQPVVERPAPQGQTLAHHAEAASVVERVGGAEAPPAVEVHLGNGASILRMRSVSHSLDTR